MVKAAPAITKRLAISKANTQMVVIVAVAAFVSVFCLVASKAVFSQYQYQGRVVSAKTKALDQLKLNIKAYKTLASSYNKFDSQSSNIIGGIKTGTGNNDGSNSTIILDSLPDTYDFPALTASIEKILTNGNFSISSIGGTDDQLNQQANISSAAPLPVPIPFSFTIDNATYTSIQTLMNTLQASVRPIQVDSINLTGGINDMALTVDAHTYYQPATNLSITSKVIK